MTTLARLRPRTVVASLFTLSVVIALVHALDDAFLLPAPGVPITQHALAAGIAVVASALAIWRFPTMRPGLQSATAFVFGALAAINGGRHAHHQMNEALTANDLTGLLALAAGVVLIGLAAWIPFAHRGEGRWLVRLIVVPAALFAAWVVGPPVGIAIVDIHSLEKAIGDKPNAAYQTVHFTTSDDLELEGWYRPSRNGASVLMVSGGGGNRRSTLRHAKMLERSGYGVLVYDPRGAGNSEGSINSWSWGWDKDVDAAIEFLKSRSDIDDGRIGALGLSSGADAAIDAAGRRHDLRAVVADGAASTGFEDMKAYTDSPVELVGTWMLFKTTEVLAGRSGPDVSLADRIADTRSPHLIIAAGPVEKGWASSTTAAAARTASSGTCPRRATRPRSSSTRRPTRSA